MKTVRVIKPFKRGEQVIPPGSVLQVPADLLPRMAGYVAPLAEVVPLHPDTWRPEPRAWLVNGELRTTGIFDDLEAEIVRLAGDNIELRDKLLELHVEGWRNRHELMEKTEEV